MKDHPDVRNRMAEAEQLVRETQAHGGLTGIRLVMAAIQRYGRYDATDVRKSSRGGRLGQDFSDHAG